LQYVCSKQNKTSQFKERKECDKPLLKIFHWRFSLFLSRFHIILISSLTTIFSLLLIFKQKANKELEKKGKFENETLVVLMIQIFLNNYKLFHNQTKKKKIDREKEDEKENVQD